MAPRSSDSGEPRRSTTVPAERLFRALGHLLPRATRDRQVDEWLDHLQCAQSDGWPIRREIVSLVRSAASITWSTAPLVRLTISLTAALALALSLWTSMVPNADHHSPPRDVAQVLSSLASSSSPTYETACPSSSLSAFSWANHLLHDIAREVGALTAGCPERLHAVSSSFVYRFGTLPSISRQSLSVASLRFGAGIVFGSAIKPLLELISRFRDIGVSPRIHVGCGDLYLVSTPLGTAVLSRASVLSDTKHTPYLVMPPAAAGLWFAAMSRSGMWLWPRQGATGRRIVLKPTSGQTFATIDVDHSTYRARWAGSRSWRSAQGQFIGQRSLTPFARPCLP
jgi:hypothetical protein